MTTPRKRRQLARKRQTKQQQAKQAKVAPPTAEALLGSRYASEVDISRLAFPELCRESIQEQAAMKSDLAREKTLAAIRLELRAVNEEWAIPEALRHRMIIEATEIMLDKTCTVAQRLFANKLLLQMNQANHNKDLPTQVTVVTPSSGTIPVYQLIQELSRDPLVMDALDYRPVKNDDYAETSD